MANSTSIKKIQIDKDTSNMVIVAAISTFILVFTLVSGNALLKVLTYHNKVINNKTASESQLKTDINSSNSLLNSYQKFNSGDTNIIGGSTSQSGGNNGNNAKIILDSLPSVYDYPALTTSMQSLLSNQGVTITSITGSDLEATYNTSASSSGPANVVVIPINISVSGPYSNIQNVINVIERSIRPIKILNMNISGDQSNVTLTISAQTYFQPATKFNITQELLK